MATVAVLDWFALFLAVAVGLNFMLWLSVFHLELDARERRADAISGAVRKAPTAGPRTPASYSSSSSLH